MAAPLNASSTQAGALFSNSTFDIPQFQREYSWQEEEVSEFWADLSGAAEGSDYFLGLIILTEEGKLRHVVDGQQRIITITLLATAIHQAAKSSGRNALAERIDSTFLHSIDYNTDEKRPRVYLSDTVDNKTLLKIVEAGSAISTPSDEESVSARMVSSFRFLTTKLTEHLAPDPFKRLGRWTDFLTNQVYFAVFIHPDAASAYQVFEVVNTRGRELTTADLLKNYVLSQTSKVDREQVYEDWQSLARQFPPEGSVNTFVQFIRHVVTVRSGHILPKDLFDFLARRKPFSVKAPPSPIELVAQLKEEIPLYMQIIDPGLGGPADVYAVQIFRALNALGVITVRPIILALARTSNFLEGLRALLKLVVRRIVVGNLGTGNVERRFAESARQICEKSDWSILREGLSDLDPSREEFIERLSRRSLNKNTLLFLRRSIIEQSISPSSAGALHFIWPRSSVKWPGFEEEDSYWYSTIGNTFLSTATRRPSEALESWAGFKRTMLCEPAAGEITNQLVAMDNFGSEDIERLSKEMADVAANIWFEP